MLEFGRTLRVATGVAVVLCASAWHAGFAHDPPAGAATSATKPPVDARATRTPDLVELTTLDPTIKVDVRYARTDNAFGKKFYPEARAFLQRPAAEALVRVHRALAADGYGLVVFDGYRPWAITKQFWDSTPDDKKVYVADPAKGSRHNRGCAVDLSLFERATGREVTMPSPYDDMTERAHATFAGGTPEERKTRELLKDTMQAEGFFVYPYEWWHYDWKDWNQYPVLDIPFSSIERVARAVPPELSNSRLIDLTWPFDDETLYWPTAPSGFELKTLAFGQSSAGFFYSANSFSAPEHGGTHLDAPVHFAQGARAVDQIPLFQLFAPAIVIDVSTKAAADRDYRLSAADVAAWETRNGRIPLGAIVLLRTGWGKHWPDRAKYFGSDRAGDASDLHFPSYGEDAARLLVNERVPGALGVDTPSLDYGPSKDFLVHQAAAKAQIPGFENLARLEELPEVGAWIVALPMKIAGGSGGPLRVVAILPR